MPNETWAVIGSILLFLAIPAAYGLASVWGDYKDNKRIDPTLRWYGDRTPTVQTQYDMEIR